MNVLKAPDPAFMQEEEITLFSDSVGKWIDEHAPPEKMAQWIADSSVPRQLWNVAGEAGLLGLSMPETDGGMGGDYRHEVVLMRQLGWKGADHFGISLHNAIVMPYIWHYGTEEQKARWLPRLQSGELVGAIAMTEPGAGSDLQGVKTTAIKAGTAEPHHAGAAIASMKCLNRGAAAAMVRTGVHAATDITGFGLLGHLFEMLDASEAAAEVRTGAVPFLPGALRYAEEGVNTGGGRSNASYLGERVRFDDDVPPPVRVACFDPQTSGGLFFSVDAPIADALVAELREAGYVAATIVGQVLPFVGDRLLEFTR